MSGERLHRLDHALMRQVNERILDLNEHWDALLSSDDKNHTVELRCECMRQDCQRTFLVSLAAFGRIREDPTLYILSAEHTPTLVEEIIERTDTYVIVRNDGLRRRLSAAEA